MTSRLHTVIPWHKRFQSSTNVQDFNSSPQTLIAHSRRYSMAKLFLHNHPLSSYAQKVRIALREKGLPFDHEVPKGLASGGIVEGLHGANPRSEVPALVDGDLKIFDSTVILGYLEDKFPEKRLLPQDPRQRAEARMLEEAYGEIVWMGRAEGELATKLHAQIRAQAGTIQAWLTEKLEGRDYFNGSSFGYADICVAPMVNRAADNGYGPEEGSPLQRWLLRVKQVPSVQETFSEYRVMVEQMPGMKEVFQSGKFKREYRDHRLEFLVKSGGIDVVLDGMTRNNIRFSWPDPAKL
nr:glutathione s-transferase u5 [Quercus suber]